MDIEASANNLNNLKRGEVEMIAVVIFTYALFGFIFSAIIRAIFIDNSYALAMFPWFMILFVVIFVGFGVLHYKISEILEKIQK